MRARPMVRSMFAVLCCLAATGLAARDAAYVHGDRPVLIGVGAIALLAAILLAVRPFWAALAGRGLAWTALAMLTLCESLGKPRLGLGAAAIALCVALLAAGHHALDRAPSTFQPQHHRGPLLLALVLGFADVATLLGWSLLAIWGAPKVALVFAVIAGAIAVSLFGLYRLRTWGFLLNLGVNLAVVGLMAFDVFHFDLFRLVFVVPAVAQILIALPVLVAIIRRTPIAVPAVLSRLAGRVPAVTVLVMAALHVQVFFGQPALVQLVRWGTRRF